MQNKQAKNSPLRMDTKFKIVQVLRTVTVPYDSSNKLCGYIRSQIGFEPNMLQVRRLAKYADIPISNLLTNEANSRMTALEQAVERLTKLIES